MKKDITELFCFLDDFAKKCAEESHRFHISNGQSYRKSTRLPELTEAEIMTILLLFQQSPCRNFKYFYKSFLQLYTPEFPRLVTYERFVALMPRVFVLLNGMCNSFHLSPLWERSRP